MLVQETDRGQFGQQFVRRVVLWSSLYEWSEITELNDVAIYAWQKTVPGTKLVFFHWSVVDRVFRRHIMAN